MKASICHAGFRKEWLPNMSVGLAACKAPAIKNVRHTIFARTCEVKLTCLNDAGLMRPAHDLAVRKPPIITDEKKTHMDAALLKP
eukprot:CAMPEP_0206488438 /NCGR_PEP_ID=MMETSP0324_2-20121206/42421_1 /ASSEMBLY_ACC=CAM_ASM_000836 /TAXON_ID=2866 /ORGANISM="Crypthecodinium cohnii, Strain Seligo" /LENGTH=84 /DNA_ID=CAMNT_0053967479 /DNA_START=168 /DNA_END=422 /DNA_ORIENTATION=+